MQRSALTTVAIIGLSFLTASLSAATLSGIETQDPVDHVHKGEEIILDGYIIPSPIDATIHSDVAIRLRAGTRFETGTTVALRVAPIPNEQPTAVIASLPSPVYVGTEIDLDGSASDDPDDFPNASLSYTWTQVDTGAPAVTIGSADQAVASVTFTDPGVHTYTFQLAVFDGTDTETATVDVQALGPVPQEVTIEAIDGHLAEAEAANDTGLIRITRHGDTTFPLTMQLTQTGTANPGMDLDPITLTPQIAAGASTYDIPLTAFDDAIDEDDETVVFTVDPGFAYTPGAASQATVTIVDDDTADILVTAPQNGFNHDIDTGEDGTARTFSVVLTSEPTADVQVSLSSSDTTEGVVGQSSLTFAPSEWDQTQVVTVTGVDDNLVDGNVFYDVYVGPASSADPNYDGIDPDDVSARNLDDDEPAILVSPTGGLTTTEAGGTALVNVSLSHPPTATVTITPSSSNEQEGTVSPATLQFDASNWSNPQVATLTGVDDAYDDGDVAYTVDFGDASSADPVWNQQLSATVDATNEDNDGVGITVAAAGTLEVPEDGSVSVTATVVLDSRPYADVTIPVASSDATEGAVNPTSLTFTDANWSTPQTITITGFNDDVVDGDQSYAIELAAATSADPAYAGIDPDDVSVTTIDDDVVGVTVAAADPLQVTESGGVTTFTVALTSEPTAVVQIVLSSSDTSEGTVAPASLDFDAGNWSNPQEVTLTGVDDQVDDGDAAFAVRFDSIESVDPGYNGLAVDDLAAVNADDDTAAIAVAPTMGLTTDETGATSQFTVVLGSRPTAAVVIGLSIDPADEVSIDASELTFDETDWDQEQTVVVTGLPDGEADGDQAFGITLTATSSDPSYAAIDPDDVSGVNQDVYDAPPELTFAALDSSVRRNDLTQIGITASETITGLEAGDFRVYDRRSGRLLDGSGLVLTAINSTEWTLSGLTSAAVGKGAWELAVIAGAAQDSSGKDTGAALISWRVVGPDASGIWHVNPFAANYGDGSSWDLALRELDHPLSLATADEEVWVTASQFGRSTSSTDGWRVPAGVVLRGSFAGDEVELSERDIGSVQSVLSGERGDPDSDADDLATLLVLEDGASVDGFTFVGARAAAGTGVALEAEGSATITRCRFEDNVGAEVGAVAGGTGMLSISGSAFIGNEGDLAGAVLVSDADVSITSSAFIDNSSQSGAGAIAASGSLDLAMEGCSFLGNTGQEGSDGGALDLAGSGLNAVIASCMWAGNAGGDAGAVTSDGATLHLINCLLAEGSGNVGAISIVGGDLEVSSSTLVDNAGSIGAGAIELTDGSLTVLNSIVHGNTGSPASIAATGSTSSIAIGWSQCDGGVAGFQLGAGVSVDDRGGVISSDPLLSADWRIGDGSPVIGGGQIASLPDDLLDLDGDGDTAEVLPVDYLGGARVADSALDLGAIEHGGVLPNPGSGDDGDDEPGGTIGIVTAPRITPPGHVFLGTTSVTVETRHGGAKTYYKLTSVGADPSSYPLSSYSEVTGPIEVSSSRSLHAVSVLNELIQSRVVTEDYTRAWATVSLVDGHRQVYEGGSRYIELVRNTESLATDVDVTVRVSANAADVKNVGDRTVHFGRWQRSATIKLETEEDNLIEGTESATISVVSSASVNVGELGSLKVDILDNDLPSPTIGDHTFNADFVEIEGTFPTVSMVTGVEFASVSIPTSASFVEEDVAAGTFTAKLFGAIPLDGSITVGFRCVDALNRKGSIASKTFSLPKKDSVGNDSSEDPPAKPAVYSLVINPTDLTGDKTGDFGWPWEDPETGEVEIRTESVYFTNKGSVRVEVSAEVPYGSLYRFEVEFDGVRRSTGFNGNTTASVPVSIWDDGLHELQAFILTRNQGVTFEHPIGSLLVVRDTVAPKLIALVPDSHRSASGIDPDNLHELEERIVLNGNTASDNTTLREDLGLPVLAQDSLTVPFLVDDTSGLASGTPSAQVSVSSTGSSPTAINAAKLTAGGIDYIQVSGFGTFGEYQDIGDVVDVPITDEGEDGSPVEVGTRPTQTVTANSANSGWWVFVACEDRCGNASLAPGRAFSFFVDLTGPIPPTIPPDKGSTSLVYTKEASARWLRTTGDVLRGWQGSTLSSGSELINLEARGSYNNPLNLWRMQQPIEMGTTLGAGGDANGQTEVYLQDVHGNISGPWTVHARRSYAGSGPAWGKQEMWAYEPPDEPAPEVVDKGLYGSEPLNLWDYDDDPSTALIGITPHSYDDGAIVDFDDQVISTLNGPDILEAYFLYDTWTLTYTDYSEVYRWVLAADGLELSPLTAAHVPERTIVHVLPGDPGPYGSQRRLIPPIWTNPGVSIGRDGADVGMWPAGLQLQITDEGLSKVEHLATDPVYRVNGGLTFGDSQLTHSGATLTSSTVTAPQSVGSGAKTIHYIADEVSSTENDRLNDRGYRWVNGVSVSGDKVIRAGGSGTIQISAAFFEETVDLASFDGTGDHLRFIAAGSDADLTYGKASGVGYHDGIRIIDQRIEAMEGDAGRCQTLIVRYEVGSQVDADLFHIDVNLGEVKGYGDVESQKQHGVNFSGDDSYRLYQAVSVWSLRVDEQVTVTQLGTIDLEDFVIFDIPHFSATDLAAARASLRIANLRVNEPNCYVLERDDTGFHRLGTSAAPIPSIGIRLLGGSPGEKGTDTQVLHYPIGANVIGLPQESDAPNGYRQGTLLTVSVEPRVVEVDHTVGAYHTKSAWPWGSGSLLGDIALVEFVSVDGEDLDLDPSGFADTGTNNYWEFSFGPNGSGVEEIEHLGWIDDTSFRIAGLKPGAAKLSVRPILDGTLGTVAMEFGLVSDLPAMTEPNSHQVEVALANVDTLEDLAAAGKDLEGAAFQPTPMPGEAAFKLPTRMRGIDASQVDPVPPAGQNYYSRTARTLDAAYEQGLFLASQILPNGSAIQYSGGGHSPGPNAIWPWHAPFTYNFNRGWRYDLPQGVDPKTVPSDLTYKQMVRLLNVDRAWSSDSAPFDDDNIANLSVMVDSRLRSRGQPLRLWERQRFKTTASGSRVERSEMQDGGSSTYVEVSALELKARSYLEAAAVARLLRYGSMIYSAEPGGPITPVFDYRYYEDLPGKSGLFLPLGAHFAIPHYGQGFKVTRTLWMDILDVWLDDPEYWLPPTAMIFATSELPMDWSINHPLSGRLIEFMIQQRMDLAEALAAANVGTGDAMFTFHPDPDDFDNPADAAAIEDVDLVLRRDESSGRLLLELDETRFRLATSNDPITQSPRALDLYTSRMGMFTDEAEVYVLQDAPNIIVRELKTDPSYSKLGWSITFDIVHGDGDIEVQKVPINTFGVAGDLVARCLYENAVIRDALDRRVRETTWEQAKTYAPISSFAYALNGVLPFGPSSDSMMRVITAQDFASGDDLDTVEYIGSVMSLILETIPGGRPASKAAPGGGAQWVAPAGGKYDNAVPYLTWRNSASHGNTRVRDAAAELAGSTATVPGMVSHGIAGGLSRMPSTFLTANRGRYAKFSEFFRKMPNLWLTLHGGAGRITSKNPISKGAQISSLRTANTWRGGGKRWPSHVDDAADAPRTAQKYKEMSDLARRQRVIADLGEVEGRKLLESNLANSCFAGDTLIAMADGSVKPIADIAAGDLVASRDQFDPEAPVTLGRVTATFVRSRAELLTIRLHRAGHSRGSDDDADCLRVTPEHPVWLLGEGWCPAGELRSGDRVRTMHGWAAIESLEAVARQDVYNFEVAESHTYFVQLDAVALWVHNTCPKRERFERLLEEEGVPWRHSDPTKVEQSYKIWAAQDNPRGIPLHTPYIDPRGGTSALRNEALNHYPTITSRSDLDNYFKGMRAHHVGPRNVVARSKLDAYLGNNAERFDNLMWLPTSKTKHPDKRFTDRVGHDGSHPGYDDAILEYLDEDIYGALQAGTITIREASTLRDIAYHRLKLELQKPDGVQLHIGTGPLETTEAIKDAWLAVLRGEVQ